MPSPLNNVSPICRTELSIFTSLKTIAEILHYFPQFIRHSPSVAAIADTHVCIHREKSSTDGRLFDVVANQVEGIERRKELARMASGDMVMDEAQVFAEALLRDASLTKFNTSKLKP